MQGAIEVDEAAEALRARFGNAPVTAAITGSGLSALADQLDQPVRARLADVGLPVPGLAGHGATIRVGGFAGAPLAVLTGRVHLYEGRTPAEVVAAVRALHAWGVRRLVLTNAAGGLHPSPGVGALVRIADHLNLTGTSPLVGGGWPERFPDAARAWTPAWGARLDAAADALELPWGVGVYAGVLGPAYETAAEARMLRTLGADVVGMSTVHEALAACALGMELAGVSVVTNLVAAPEPADHAVVVAAAERAAHALTEVLRRAVHPVGLS